MNFKYKSKALLLYHLIVHIAGTIFRINIICVPMHIYVFNLAFFLSHIFPAVKSSLL
jgi:hypothetical protein